MAANRSRPLSPHLTIWRWGPHMLVSILHRMTGAGLATVGVVGLVWWLTAAAMGPEAYETFYACATGWLGKLIGIGLTRSEEHTSELQSLMRISYAVFCLKKKKYIDRVAHQDEIEHEKDETPDTNSNIV